MTHVGLDEREGRLETTRAQSDVLEFRSAASPFRSAERLVHLNVSRGGLKMAQVESDMPLFQSDLPHFQSAMTQFRS